MVEEVMQLYVSPSCIAPPREAYKFWNHQSYALMGKGKNILRFVFFRQEFTPLESENLLRLEREIEKGIEIPMKIERENLLRFCYGTDWKTQKAVKILKSFLEFRKTIPLDYKMLLPKVYKFLNTGTFYIHGRDYMFRPVLVLNVGKFDFKENKEEDYVEYMVFLLEYVIHEMLLPGQVENWVIICDFNKRGIRSLPLKKTKQVADILMQNFSCRLGVTYIVNTPATFSLLWGMVKPFMDPTTLAKMKLTKKNTSNEMLEGFNPLQLEEKYGGRAPNLQQYWPPYVPDSSFHNNKGVINGNFGNDTYEEYFPPAQQIQEQAEIEEPAFHEDVAKKRKKKDKRNDELADEEKQGKKKKRRRQADEEPDDNNHPRVQDEEFTEAYHEQEQERKKNRKHKKKYRNHDQDEEIVQEEVQEPSETKEERRERRRRRRELRRQREEEAALAAEEEIQIIERAEEQGDEIVFEAEESFKPVQFSMNPEIEDRDINENSQNTEIISNEREVEAYCAINVPCGKLNCQLM